MKLNLLQPAKHAGIFFISAVFVLVIPGLTGGNCLHNPVLQGGLLAEDYPEPLKNYHKLDRLYRKWHEGLFGSRKYHEKKLRSFLWNLIGKEIITDYDFMLSSPEGVVDKEIRCNLRFCRWLYIHGELDTESVRNAVKDNYAALPKWWRSGIMVAVTGTVKKFRLGRDKYGDTIHIFLDKVRVVSAENGGRKQ